jgi:hypothetical protein
VVAATNGVDRARTGKAPHVPELTYVATMVMAVLALVVGRGDD